MKNHNNDLKLIKSQITEITCDDLQKKLCSKKQPLLIDVREKHETTSGTLPHARNIGRSLLESKIPEIAKDLNQEIILYCAGGTRSALSAKSLQDMGYKNVFSLQGGIQKWQEAGFVIESSYDFTPEETNRYARHFALPEIGPQGQSQLLKTKVLIVGAGGLGSPAALYLAAAGIGTLGIVDHDVVDFSNLQRQILHSEKSINTAKVESAKNRLKEINSQVSIQTYQEKLTSKNVKNIFANYDFIVNGCDNFPTRYLINDSCYFFKKPMIDGAIFRFEGHATIYKAYEEGPCYRCLYPSPPSSDATQNCQEAGVLGVLPGIIGSIQALETIKLALNLGNPLINRLLIYDTLAQNVFFMKTRKNPDCALCGKSQKIKELSDMDWSCSL